MKHFVWLLLFAAMMIPVSLFAQTDTVNVPSDAGSGGNLNSAIATVIQADPTGAQLSNTVFKLEPFGYYILTATITTPPHSHLYVVGPQPGNTPQTSLPMILWTSASGVTEAISFDCYGDFTIKNVWIMCANNLGAQVASSITMEDDSLANLSGKGEHLDMDGCIIDYRNGGNDGAAIDPACRHFRGKITNTYFRNMIDTHLRYYGRAVSWAYQSTTWHTDSLVFENCTIANYGYAYMQESPEYADYVSFNHCTFLNGIMFTLESSYWWNLSVTNCLFVNSFMYGDIPGSTANLSPLGGSNTPNGGTVNIDSTSTVTFPVPFTDSSSAPASRQRHILFANCSYGFQKWYTDYLASNPTGNADSSKPFLMPMMSGKTLRFFVGKDSTTGQKLFPYMTAVNLYPANDTSRVAADYLAYDPGFSLDPTNIDSIKVFLLGRWKTGQDINWSYDGQNDYKQVWPLNEDLSYSNAALKTAAMGGFPLGDLYHWWGPLSATNEYTLWQAQATAEHDTITKWLTNGKITGVKERTGTPVNYVLSQNYPNPFNPTTQINYSVPKNGFVTLKVYDVLGQEVATLFSGQQHAGNYTATFEGAKFASGVYFYRLQAGNISITKKLMLMK
jgi:hypothetical protein